MKEVEATGLAPELPKANVLLALLVLAASPNVNVEVAEEVVVVAAAAVAPNVVVAGVAWPKLKPEVCAEGAAAPNVTEAVAVVAAAVVLALDPNENEGAPPPPPLPKENVGGAAGAEAVAAAAVVVVALPNENVVVAVAAAELSVVAGVDAPKENPPPAAGAFPKVKAGTDAEGAAAAEEVVVAVEDTGVAPKENDGEAEAAAVPAPVAAAVVFACPKLNEGAAEVVAEVEAGIEVVEAPKENDRAGGIVGWVVLATAVVAVVSVETLLADDPNEKLAAGAEVSVLPNDKVAGADGSAAVGFEVAAVAPWVEAAGEAEPKVKEGGAAVTEAAADVVVVVVVLSVFPEPKENEEGWDGFAAPPPKEKAGALGTAVVVLVVAEALDDAAPKEKPAAAGGVGLAVVEVGFELEERGGATAEDVVLPKEKGGGEAAEGVSFFSSSFFFSSSSDFFSMSPPKLHTGAFAFSGPSLTSSFSSLAVPSPKENVTLGVDKALSESEADTFGASAADLSWVAPAPSVTSFFFSPPSLSVSASFSGGPNIISLSSKVESKSATLLPKRLLSAS